MKAVILRGVNDLVVEEVPTPKPTGDEVLIEVTASGVCGTDVHMWAGTNHEGTFPFIPGHEFCGTVVELGNKVKKLKVGDRVTGECFIGCGVCSVCQNGGAANFCHNSRYYGFAWDTPGALSEYNCSPEERLIKVPDEVSDEAAAMTEPVSVAYHAVWNRGRGVGPHDRVGIFGTGPIGLFAMMASLMSGAQVIVVEPKLYRQEMARKFGATTIIDPSAGDPVKEIMELTKCLGLTRIIECSGSVAGIAMTVDVIGVDGVIVLTGQSVGTKIPTELGKLIWKHASIVGSCGSQDWFDKTLAFMQKVPLRLEDIITHKFTLDQALEAFELGNKGAESGMIMMYPNGIVH